jgi:orotate phosphoribosyltransferase
MDYEPGFIDQLADRGTLRHGHFAFRSGRHSGGLIDRDLLLADPAIASRFGYWIAKQFFTQHIETIATPSIWGAGLAQWVGYFLEPKAKVVDATPRDGALTIAAKLIPLVSGRRVLLVDNLIISGETMQRFAGVVSAAGGKIAGVATLWCSAGDEIAGRAVVSALNREFPAFPADDCPLCLDRYGQPEYVDY